MNWLAILLILGFVLLAFFFGLLVAVRKNPKKLAKLLTYALVFLVLSILIGAILLFPTDSLAGVEKVWAWLARVGMSVRRFVAMLLAI
jgi:predicted branched-subunit amino acid permease